MQDAQSQAIPFDIGSARLVPADVGGVEGNRHAAEPHVEPAGRAAIFVCFEHSLAEGRVALAAGDGRLQRESDRIQDVRVERLGEMPLENPAGNSGQEARIGGEGRPERPARTPLERHANAAR